MRVSPVRVSRRVSRSRCSSPAAADHLGARVHGDVVDRRRSGRSGTATSRPVRSAPRISMCTRRRVPGEVDRRLPGRVGPADDVDVLPGAARRLGGGRAVEDPPPGEVGQPRARRARRYDTPVASTTACAAISVPSPKRTSRAAPASLETDHLPGAEQLGAELDRLPPGPIGQLRAGDAVREAQVVLDPAALPGLTAGRPPLDQHGAQPLRRAVHRRAEPGRARRRSRPGRRSRTPA